MHLKKQLSKTLNWYVFVKSLELNNGMVNLTEQWNPFSTETDFRRQILTSKVDPTLKELKMYNERRSITKTLRANY